MKLQYIVAAAILIVVSALWGYAGHKHTCVSALFGGRCYKECPDP